MNTALEAQTSLDTTTAHPVSTHAPRERLTLANRLALRLGMALIIWSRRTARRVSRDELRRTHELRLQLVHERREAQLRHDWIGLGRR